MSAHSTPAAAEPQSDDDALKARILADPGFVLNDPEMMRALLGAHDGATRQIVDLRSVLIERLERRLGRLREAHRDVVDAAWSSVAGAEQAQLAVLAMLDADSLQRFIEVLVVRLPRMLQVDVARLCLEGADARGAVGPRAERALAVVEAGAVERRLPWRASGATVRFRGSAEVDPELFGGDAARLRSEALIALNLGEDHGPGLLALGAVDPDRFGERHDADSLMFLGAVISRLLRRWLERNRSGR